MLFRVSQYEISLELLKDILNSDLKQGLKIRKQDIRESLGMAFSSDFNYSFKRDTSRSLAI